MSVGTFSYPIPVNEPVHSYAPGSIERAALKKTLSELKNYQVDVPMYIGGEEVRSGKLVPLNPPHEKAHVLGHYHAGDEHHVKRAINCALEAKEAWTNMNWEDRAGIFFKSG